MTKSGAKVALLMAGLADLGVVDLGFADSCVADVLRGWFRLCLFWLC